ncbi:MAG TPA: hypothetical protein VM553_11070, partial [Dongiaceae bacterium]|nr:hypothetical protein [Dongiaceae bacterium]
LKQSLQVSFMVLDAQGTAVASGSPGDKPLELPAGQYRIKVGNVEIPATISPDETTAITLP